MVFVIGALMRPSRRGVCRIGGDASGKVSIEWFDDPAREGGDSPWVRGVCAGLDQGAAARVSKVPVFDCLFCKSQGDRAVGNVLAWLRHAGTVQ